MLFGYYNTGLSDRTNGRKTVFMTIKQASLGVLAAVLFMLGMFQTVDPDLWWHLKTGQVILSQGLPRVDIFSFTMAGTPWTTHEWLSEVIMWWLYAHAGGLPALSIVFALIAVLTFGLVYFTCAGRPALALPLTLLAFWTTRFLWGARPQIFNILMLALVLWLMEQVRQKKFSLKALYVLPVLILLWANLHSGYLMGLAVLGVYLAGDLLQIFLWKSEEGTFGRTGLKCLGIIFPLCILASLVNPSGYRLWLYPFETLGSQMMQRFILEWKAPDFHFWNYKPFMISMGLGAVAFMASSRRRNIAEMIFYGGAMAAGLISRRHIPFFAVVAFPILSRAFLDCFQTEKARAFWSGSAFSSKLAPGFRIFNLFLVAVCLFFAAFVAQKVLAGNDEKIREKYPVAAIKFLKEKGFSVRHGFNEYVWGGYMLWSDLPVFMDGRVDMYGDRFFRDYLLIRDLKEGVGAISSVFQQFDVTYALIPPQSAFASFLRSNKQQWNEIYRDGTASLFLALPAGSPESASPRLSLYGQMSQGGSVS